MMTNNYFGFYLTVLILSLFTFIACNQNKPEPFKGKVFRTAQNQFGYSVYDKDENILINQIYIPSIPGNQNFKDSIDAQKVMTLVLNKLNKNQIPSVTTDDLIELKIKF